MRIAVVITFIWTKISWHIAADSERNQVNSQVYQQNVIFYKNNQIMIALLVQTTDLK